MSGLLPKGSSKRHRPKVPLDQRKRTIKACTQCRIRKRRCIPESLSRCWNCRKHSLDCGFETRKDSPVESGSSQIRIDHDDVVAQFNKSYPDIDLKVHHSSLLLEIYMDSIQKSSGSSRRESMARIKNHVPDTTETPIQCDNMLSHKDFLACAAAAVSQSERPRFTEHIGSFDPTDTSNSRAEAILKQQVLEDFPSQAVAKVLVSMFFFYAEANWYFFDENSFKEQLFELYSNSLSPTRASPKFICLVLTVFALGSHFVHLYHTNHPNDSELTTGFQKEIPGTRYFQHAQRFVPQIIASPSLEGLQSCLILALYVLPIHGTEPCYTYLGLALRIATILGLHRNSACSVLSPSLSEIQNRVFWTTYSIERWVALSLGYPETLNPKDIGCPLPRRNPELDVQGSFRAERLLAYTKLTLLLNRVICLRTLDQFSTEDIRRQLLSWKADLPVQLATLDGNCLRFNVHLQLHYSMIWIYIGRAALVDKVRRLLSKKEPTKDDSQELSDACSEHAAQIIDLIDLLRSQGQLGLFSYTDFHACSFATIIVLLDSVLNPRLTSFPRVKAAMDSLRYMATGSDLAKNSLKYVEHFQRIVNKALASMRHMGSHGEAESEAIGMPYQHGVPEPNLAFSYDIESLLDDCSFTELHILGLDSLHSSNVIDSNGGC